MTQWKHLWKDVGIVYKYFMGQPGDVIPAHEYMNIFSFYFIFILFYSIKDLTAAWKKKCRITKGRRAIFALLSTIYSPAALCSILGTLPGTVIFVLELSYLCILWILHGCNRQNEDKWLQVSGWQFPAQGREDLSNKTS